jgi:hypothetical protein
MAGNSSSTSWAWPPPGMFALDTIGSYNPVTSWLSGAMGQIGFININNTSSGDPDMEKSIIGEVAGYGRQLGWITEALQVVCKHPDHTKWGPDERRAVENFNRMADQIEAHKRKDQPVTTEAFDQFLIAIRDLKEQNQAFYEQLLQFLHKSLPPSSAPALPHGTNPDGT